MRTTVTLDADVESLLRRAIRERGESFKRVLNDGLRQGLRKPAPQKAPRFVQKTHVLGPARVDLTKALSLAAELEDVTVIGKYRALNEVTRR